MRCAALGGARALLWVALPLLAAGVSGCATTDPDVIVVTTTAGTLIVDWTIEGRVDPADCQLTGSAVVQIHLVESSGFDAGTYEQDCTVFSTSIVLDPGTYAATALLVDFAGQPRSTVVTLAPFTFFGNDLLRAPIDFPADSFF